MGEETETKKILLVDDDEFFLWFEREGLERSHFDMREAKTADEAVAAAKEFKPDLMLLDYYLGDKNGDYVIEEIRRDKELSSMPIVIVTSDDSPGKKEELLKLGATDFLKKPIVINDLLAKVNNLINEPHRVDQRTPMPNLKIKYKHLEELIQGSSEDLSKGGIFVKTKKPMEPGNTVNLSLVHADNAIEPFEVEGIVVRVTDESMGENAMTGMGVKFINLTDKSRKMVEDIIEAERTSTKLDVLIIEDDKIIGEMLLDVLSEANLKVKLFEDGFDALKNIHLLDPTLIITDIMMPKLDGLEFCKALRNNSSTKDTPFVFISGRTDEETVKKAKELGAAFFIAKPFTMDTIFKCISSVLGREIEVPSSGE